MTDTGRKNQDFKEKISTGEPMRLNKFLSDAVCVLEDRQTAMWSRAVF